MESERHPLPILQDSEAGIPRRSFLQLVGAGLALAACEPPRGHIYPYSRQPRNLVTGKAQHYATSRVERGYAQGLLVKSVAGRPIKVDGNPDHPATLGRSSPRLQASIYDLYDPARGREFRRGSETLGWSTFLRDIRDGVPNGKGLHFLLEPTSSPFVIAQIQRVRAALPEARWHFYDPLAATGVDEAGRRAFGRVVLPHPRFDKAAVIASFDADFLSESPAHIRHAWDYSRTRQVRGAGDAMSRLWMAEGDLSLTGCLADQRLRIRPSRIPALLAALVAELARGQGRLPPAAGPLLPALGAFAAGPAASPWIAALAKDLLAKPGASLVLAGERQPAEAHLLAWFANALLGNIGATLVFTDPVLFEAGSESHDPQPLAQALDRGEVDTLVILGGDPARTMPADLGFAEQMSRARRGIYSGLHDNDTGRRCAWYLPAAHFLEQWGDARAYDGTLSLIQPLIRPLWGGKTPTEILGAFAGDPAPDDRGALRALYATVPQAEWQNALQWGFFAGALPPLALPFRQEALAGLEGTTAGQPPSGLEISLRADDKLLDGSHARNGWLVELPDPVTHLSWQNAATLSPETAARLGLEEGQVIELGPESSRIRVPVLPLRGMADEVIGLRLGWGQPAPPWAGGRSTDPNLRVGVDVFPLRTRQSPWFLLGAEPRKVQVRASPLLGPSPARERILRVNETYDTHDRPILLSASLETWRRDPDFVSPHNRPTPDLYGSPWAYTGHQWGMSIDLSTCIGCTACVVACQAENNTPIVGPVNIAKGRQMHWLRIDRYYLGKDADDVQLLPQPMLCLHCERAPCEYVCPVNATVHSPDGLNEMVYNRCIGTRFCSNNCPYKVRRFNYLRWNAKEEPQTLQMAKNPDVTVRERGVMEKCTYCVQRIREAEIDARIEQRPLREGEVRTACQVACPTDAIVFGLISDPDSPVSQLREIPRSYSLLNQDLGTEPRTRFVAHLRNPSTEL